MGRSPSSAAAERIVLTQYATSQTHPDAFESPASSHASGASSSSSRRICSGGVRVRSASPDDHRGRLTGIMVPTPAFTYQHLRRPIYPLDDVEWQR
jgi:hypothetical protein